MQRRRDDRRRARRRSPRRAARAGRRDRRGVGADRRARRRCAPACRRGRCALGGGEYLRVELSTRHSREVDVEAAFERDRRASCARSAGAGRSRGCPRSASRPATSPTNERVAERIDGYLRALAAIDRASNAFVTRGTQLIAAAREPDELEATRWPFLARRALATPRAAQLARRGRSIPTPTR